MKKHIASCRQIFLVMVAISIIYPLHPVYSYEQEIANLSSMLSSDIVKSGKKGGCRG